MMIMPTAPREGDLVWVDFDPVKGSEQSGIRPAIVISSARFNAETHRSIVCPITRNVDPWPTKVFLPEGLPVGGAVLTDQVRSLDRRGRGFRLVGRAPESTLREVRETLAAIVGIEAA